jgi:hypothetical protein
MEIYQNHMVPVMGKSFGSLDLANVTMETTFQAEGMVFLLVTL